MCDTPFSDNNEEYIATVKAILGAEYEEVAEHYSFSAANEQGYPPEEAVHDAKEWLNG